MKHTYKLLLALPILTLAISSCDGKLDELVEDGSYTISKDANYATFENLTDSFEVESSSSTKTLSIKSVGSNWQLSSDESWIHFDKSSGTGNQEVTCSFDNNPYSYKKRRGNIILRTSGSSISTTAIQEEASPSMNCNPSSIKMSAAGGTVKIDVTTNGTNVRITDCPDYAEATYSNGQLTVTLNPNTERYYRSGSIDLSYDYLSYYSDNLSTQTRTIDIYQEGPAITVTPSYSSVEAVGGTVDITVSSDLPWEATSTDDWLQYNPTRGDAGNTTMTVQVAPNNTYRYRTGYIRLYVGDNNIKTIEINQYGN